MHYVCIENNIVISILNYQPNVPGTVSVYQISDSQADQISLQTHYFDVSSKSVKPVDPSVINQKNKEISNGIEREFLNSTDWKVLRHIRQKALGIQTSLSEAEYLQLEQQRHQAASRIT